MNIYRLHFKTIHSTNTWAKEHASELPIDKLTFITAEEQTAGRGRFSRKWISPPNRNIYATFCCFIDKKRQDLGNLAQILAISAIQALSEMELNGIKIKWPNDLILNDKKLGGILCETIHENDQLLVIMGIGINVNMEQEILDQIDQPATSLKTHFKKEFNLDEILEKLSGKTKYNLNVFLNSDQGFKEFYETFLSLLNFKPNQKIKIKDGSKFIEGNFHSINEDGTISLNCKFTDNLIQVNAGELIY